MLKRYLWDIIGLAKVWWLGCGIQSTDDEHKIWLNVEDSTGSRSSLGRRLSIAS
ncbi:hypothetical protein DPMN_189157 [Dreissena polymorpha]|uniref:Uncharacterized protein n=1 Tax=Dreissena polymorpha TaxID=45954 RepID=A0A9D4IBZ1_DREPO|nr:hypothetical protein DPMN_189157 [Dreissena polymorpha]